MIAMTDPAQADLIGGQESTGRWLVKLPAAVSVDHQADRNLADLIDDLTLKGRPSRRSRFLLATTRFAITFGIGIAATMAWQPYGDAAREMFASSSLQLGWLAPQPATAQGAPGPQPRDVATADFDAVRDRIDRISSGQDQMTRAIGELTASQERIAKEIAKLREVEQYLLYKTSYREPEPAVRPAAPAGAAHKPVRRPSSTGH
jgi:hypothetical protein